MTVGSRKHAVHVSPKLVDADTMHKIGSTLMSTLITMIGTLIVTGVLGMVTLYTRVSTLTETVQTMQVQVQRSLDHTVDRDEYLRRDAQIQHGIDSMATKDELRGMQRQLDEQTETLKIIEGAVSTKRRPISIGKR